VSPVALPVALRLCQFAAEPLQPRQAAICFATAAEIQEPPVERGLIDMEPNRQPMIDRVTEFRCDLRISDDSIGRDGDTCNLLHYYTTML
jgi:hypothetical protein